MTIKQRCVLIALLATSSAPIWAAKPDAAPVSWSFDSCPVDSYSLLEYSPPPIFSTDRLDITDVSAEQVDNIGKTTSTFSGNVRIERHQLRLLSDQAKHYQQEQKLEFTGNIHIDTQSMTLEADTGWINMQSNEGEFLNSTYYIPEMHLSGKTPLFKMSSDQISTLIDTQFSTCPTNKLDWYMNTSWLELDQKKRYGTAKHTVFWLKDVPVLYLPWIRFPLGEERRSGFLMPGIGKTSKSGFEFSAPWYWNITSNHDAIITPTYLRDRGNLLSTDYRYLTRSSKGNMNLEYLDKDKIYGDERYLLHFDNQSKITDQLNFSLLINDASDSEYLQDLGTSIGVTNTTHLERTARFNFVEGPWKASLTSQSYQTIDDNIALTSRPYQRKPQLKLSGEDEILDMDFSYITASLDTEWVEFEHEDPTREQGKRFHLYPKFSVPFESNAWFVKPSLGYSFTQYDTTDTNGDDLNIDDRGLSIFSLDSGLFFENSELNSNFIQTLEPRLFYLNIPYTDQSNIPVFDTAETDFNFSSLFRENRFNGIDRIGDANQMTMALSSRILNKNTGNEVFNFSIGQIYYFDEQRVTLNSSSKNTNTRDIISEIGGSLYQWKARATYQWNPETDRSDRRSIQLHYGASDTAVFNIGYRFYRDNIDENQNLEQSDVSFAWPFVNDFILLGRWNYSLVDNSNVDTLIGIEYESCCWALRVVSQRYLTKNSINIEDPYNSTIMFQFVLKGFGSISDKEATDTLKYAILGYRPDN